MNSAVDLTQDRRHDIVSTVTAFLVLSAVVVAMRLAARCIKHTRLILSDYLAVAGLIFVWVVSIIGAYGTTKGLGLHMQVIFAAKGLNAWDNIRQLRINLFILEIFYAFALGLIKLSVLSLYRNLFPSRYMVLYTNILGALSIGWAVACGVLVPLLECRPIHGFWDLLSPHECIDERLFYVGSAVPNILTDVLILALPMREVWKLQLVSRDKVTLTMTFLLGYFVVIAAALRIHYVLQGDPNDQTYSYTGIAIWTCIELNVAVISCSLPTIRPTVAFLTPSCITRRMKSLNSKSPGPGRDLPGKGGKAWPAHHPLRTFGSSGKPTIQQMGSGRLLQDPESGLEDGFGMINPLEASHVSHNGGPDDILQEERIL